MKMDQPEVTLKVNQPMTEEQIQAAHIGEHRPLNGRIYLAPYDPGWPAVYHRLVIQIREALGDTALQLEHVGSTSVPGLSAKPIIDMLLVVADSSDETTYVRPLEGIGYTLHIREPDWYQHRLLKPPNVKANLHVFSAGCVEIERMLRFRDWLRSHPEDRQLYETKKRDLAARTWKYTQNYADAKSNIVEEILSRARKRNHELHE